MHSLCPSQVISGQRVLWMNGVGGYQDNVKGSLSSRLKPIGQLDTTVPGQLFHVYVRKTAKTQGNAIIIL